MSVALETYKEIYDKLIDGTIDVLDFQKLFPGKYKSQVTVVPAAPPPTSSQPKYSLSPPTKNPTKISVEPFGKGNEITESMLQERKNNLKHVEESDDDDDDDDSPMNLLKKRILQRREEMGESDTEEKIDDGWGCIPYKKRRKY